MGPDSTHTQNKVKNITNDSSELSSDLENLGLVSAIIRNHIYRPDLEARHIYLPTIMAELNLDKFNYLGEMMAVTIYSPTRTAE